MMNPVLRREAITSLRNRRSFINLTLYVIAIVAVMALFIEMLLMNSRGLLFDPADVKYSYIALTGMQIAAIMLSTPALCAGSISGERERQTLDLLLVTDLTPLEIVMGKLMASLAMVLLMTLTSLPIYAICLYFGTLSVLDVLGMMVFFLVSACAVGSVSIYFSCKIQKTVISILCVYLLIGLACLGTLIWSVLGIAALQSNLAPNQAMPAVEPFSLALVANPALGFFSLIEHQLNMNILSNSLSTIFITAMGQKIMQYQYLFHLIFDVLVIVLFLFLATRAINPIRRTEKRKHFTEKKRFTKKEKKNVQQGQEDSSAQ